MDDIQKPQLETLNWKTSTPDESNVMLFANWEYFGDHSDRIVTGFPI
jgi:hypothetical protein